SAARGSMAAAAGFTATSGRLTIPAATAPGEYFVLVQADGEGRVNETREGNNTEAVSLAVQALPSCTQAPVFGGITTAASNDPYCRAELFWDAAHSPCANPITYNVYRTSSSSVPPLAQYRIAAGVTSPHYYDSDVVSGARQHYLVTAVDAVTGIESADNQRIHSVQVICDGSAPAPTFGASAGGSPSAPVASGAPVTLTWDMLDARMVWLVGTGDVPAVGSQIVQPTATTTYDLHADFGSGVVAFAVTVHVDGQEPAPTRLGPCSRPCGDAVTLDGELHYCRGVVNHDHRQNLGGSVDVEPIWITTSDWAVLFGEHGQPRSTYCFEATCGNGEISPFRWKAPHTPPVVESIWNDPYLQSHAVETVGDGYDNDCDGEIDELQ
ncbi:MAG: hypothetical protein MI919_05260, partial [Holophagales bacterium]|nr:hypothetical protein [Holophagales bacterium]